MSRCDFGLVLKLIYRFQEGANVEGIQRLEIGIESTIWGQCVPGWSRPPRTPHTFAQTHIARQESLFRFAGETP